MADNIPIDDPARAITKKYREASLLDLFAGLAMAGWYAGDTLRTPGAKTAALMAVHFFDMAEAMVAESERRHAPGDEMI